MTPETEAIFKNDIDRFGDSYTTEASVAQLKDVFVNMDDQIAVGNRTQLINLS